jgi:hypothetical protein
MELIILSPVRKFPRYSESVHGVNLCELSAYRWGGNDKASTVIRHSLTSHVSNVSLTIRATKVEWKE